jgi:c-di-GMP-binding flagellar brake protein YcgR
MHLLTLNTLTGVKKSQRRNFFRVPFFESLSLLRMNKPLPDEIINKYKAAHEKELEKYKDRKDIIVDDPPPFFEEHQIECRDISGGGIRCLSRNALELFEIVQGTIHLDGFSVEFLGEVIRVCPSNDSVYPFEFGIKFTELDENSRTRLIGYIFKKQRNLMKKD